MKNKQVLTYTHLTRNYYVCDQNNIVVYRDDNPERTFAFYYKDKSSSRLLTPDEKFLARSLGFTVMDDVDVHGPMNELNQIYSQNANGKTE